MKNKEEILLRCAESGDPVSMYRLAALYTRSKRVQKALQWLLSASKVKYAKAFGPLGVFYSHGYFIENSLDKAISLWIEGVDLGDSESMYYLAYQYEYGEGVKKDADKSLELHTRASNLGNTNSMFALYYNYKWGGIVRENATLAEEWHCKLLKQEKLNRQKELETRFPSLYEFIDYCPNIGVSNDDN